MRVPSIIGIMLLALALLNAGCRNENSQNTNALVRQTDNGPNTTATTPAPNVNTQATPVPATPTATTPVAAGADALPVTDAAAFRDRLLALAQGVKFAGQASAVANAEAIRAAWQQQYPTLKFSLFYSLVAAPDTVSSSDTFLTTGMSGNYDQLYAFAVVDMSGRCAGGAAVIPGDNANRKVSNATAPTVFKAIEMSKAKSCTGEAAGENYRP